jgi:hypothetical protein
LVAFPREFARHVQCAYGVIEVGRDREGGSRKLSVAMSSWFAPPDNQMREV